MLANEDNRVRTKRGEEKLSLLKHSLLIFIALAVMVLVLTFKLNVQHRILAMGYRISQENNKKKQLLQEKRRMEIEIEYLKSPERMKEEAQDKLGMKEPSREQIVYLKVKERVK